MKKISLNLLLTSVCLLSISCSHKKSAKKADLKSINGLSYIEAETNNPELLAKFGDIEITTKEIEQKSKVIQELNKIEKKLYSILMYRSANKFLEEKMKQEDFEEKEFYELKIFAAEPEEGFENLAKQLKLRWNNKIKPTFIADEERPSPETLGQFESVTFTNDNLEKDHIRYIEILTQKYDEYLKQVEGTITRKLLFAEAKKQGVSVQDLIENKIVRKKIEPTGDQVISFMKSKNISEQEMSDDLKNSFKNILIERNRNEIISKYVSTHLVTSPIQFYIKPPTIEFDINPEWSPLFGDKTAQDTIYFFTNPNCSACKVTKDNIMKTLDSSNFDIKMHTFFFYPEWDREAKMYSEASMCVFLQNKDSFWDYTNKIVDFEGKVEEKNLNSFVTEVGANFDEFKTCFLNRKTKDIVKYHLDYADYLGVNSQPTLIVKGKIYPGTIDSEKLIQVFSNSSKRAKKMGFLARIVSYIKGIFS